MIKLFRYLSGYVRIEVTGEKIESIINLCALNNIAIWNIVRKKDALRICMSIKDYFSLFGLRKDIVNRPSIKLLEKRGIIFKLRNIKNRPGTVFGLTLFLLINYFLSCFIWGINIEGNVKIPDEEIVAFCEQNDIFTGAYKRDIDSEKFKNSLPMRFDSVAWASINVEGSIATVNISESDDSEELNNTPANLTASVDGIIKKIEITKGLKKCEAGDVVSKGDILASGIIETNDKTRYIRSEGEVLAQTRRKFRFEINKSFTYTRQNGICDKKSLLRLFWFKVPLYFTDVEGYNTSYMIDSGSKLPIGIETRNYILAESAFNSIDENEAENFAVMLLCEKLRKYEIISIDDYSISVEASDDKYILTIYTVCTENIAVQTGITEDSYP